MANQNKDKKDNKEDQPKPKFNAFWIYAVIIAVFIGLQFFSYSGKDNEINWNRLKEMLVNQEIAEIVVINREKAEIHLSQEALQSGEYKDIGSGAFEDQTGPHFIYNIGTVELFNKKVEEAQSDMPENEQVAINYETRRDVFGELLGWLLPVIILVVIWIIIFRRLGSKGGGGAGNIFSVGKSKAKLFDKESNVKINFSNVAGLEEAKVEIKEVVDFLKQPQKYTDLGGKIPKGALLVGPPGTGKTLLAKAVAGEANVPFFSISGSDFVEMFVGVGASRVRDLFKQAKEKAPCIIFIDEIDAIGRARGKNPSMGANDERENTLNQLLSEMDGFGDNSGVIIMAATNRADILDRALMRAGRFDRQIQVELPDLNERKEIFQVHLKPLKLGTSVDLEFLSKQTPGFSGADIANICNEAALIAARRNRKAVEKDDFVDAVDRIIAGMVRKSKVISPEEKQAIAYHEAGHATVSWFLKHANPLFKVTIVPRGRALGAAWYLPEERQITTTEQMMDEMCAALGGRAAEELKFKDVSTGALNDLERTTKQAYAMISYFGMGEKLGNLSFYDSTGQSEYTFSKPYSEKTAEGIDEEAKKLIDSAYNKAINLLKEHEEGLDQLSAKLLEDEVIFKEDLEAIFGKRPFKTREEIAEENEKNKKKRNQRGNQEAGHQNNENDSARGRETSSRGRRTGRI